MDISGFSVDKNLRYLGIPGDSQCVTFIFIPDPGRSPMVTFWACFFFNPLPQNPQKKTQQKVPSSISGDIIQYQITSFQQITSLLKIYRSPVSTHGLFSVSFGESSTLPLKPSPFHHRLQAIQSDGIGFGRGYPEGEMEGPCGLR